jgi:hypothetical protein
MSIDVGSADGAWTLPPHTCGMTPSLSSLALYVDRGDPHTCQARRDGNGIRRPSS